MASSMEEPNKDERHKFVREHDAERRKRANRLFHWSLDMPPADDDMDVRVNKNQGITWKELAVVAAALLGGGALYNNWNTGDQTPPAATSPADSEYEVRFYDADGNLIEIPNIADRK